MSRRETISPHDLADPSAFGFAGALTRVYTVCVFDDGAVTPRVRLIDAHDDAEAISVARTINPSKRREVWDRHRLIAGFQAMRYY